MVKRTLAAAVASAFCTGLLTGQASAADGQLSYPPGPPPPIDNAVYAPALLTTADISVAVGMLGASGGSAFEVLGAGRVNVPLQGGPWNLTGEIFAVAVFDDPTYVEYLGAAHLYHKTLQYAHGVYVSGLGYGVSGFSGHEIAAGVEAAAFLGNTTLVGRLGHNWGDGYTYWSAEGIARYYVTPNTKLVGIVAWASDPGTVMLAGGVEHLFTGTHTTGFARVGWFTGDGDNAWEVLAGARFLFGRPGTTLQQHDWDIPFAEATAINF